MVPLSVLGGIGVIRVALLDDQRTEMLPASRSDDHLDVERLAMTAERRADGDRVQLTVPKHRDDVLIGQPMIGYRNCRSTVLLEETLRQQGVTLDTVFRSEVDGTVRGLAASGMGAALVPRLAVEPDPRILVRPLPLDFPARIIGLAQGRR